MSKNLKGMSLSKDEVKQEYDLEELTGVDLSSRPDLRASIGQAFIDKMIDRTESAKDNSNKSMTTSTPYSKEYRDSDEYKAYGKTRKVNMELTGSMLDAMDIIGSSGSKVTVGFDGKENAKAYGHMTGMEGHPTIKNGKQRHFFGLSVKDQKAILAEYKSDIDEIKKENKAGRETSPSQTAFDLLKGTETINKAPRDVIADLFFGDLDG